MRKEWFLIKNCLLKDRNEKPVTIFSDILRKKKFFWPLFMGSVQLFQDCKPPGKNNLLLKTKTPGFLGTYSSDLKSMKGWDNLGATPPGMTGLEIQHLTTRPLLQKEPGLTFKNGYYAVALWHINLVFCVWAYRKQNYIYLWVM